jgi:SAM-dependent methyltransferase
LKEINPQRVLDLGANDGVFSRFAAEIGAEVFSFDIDPACVETHYQQLKKEKNSKITPLVVDITNPEPSFGWNNTERPRLFERLKVDTIMALALIHHLRISNNTPLSKIAEFFSFYCQYLIIEFVPKSDDKVQRLLQNRVDIFDDYTIDGFKGAFMDYFTIEKIINFEDNNRILFLMKKK